MNLKDNDIGVVFFADNISNLLFAEEEQRCESADLDNAFITEKIIVGSSSVLDEKKKLVKERRRRKVKG